MSALFLGQRVRIVGCLYFGNGPTPTGQEGRINRKNVTGINTGFVYQWGVDTDSGRAVACNSRDLEPIVPEGMSPVEWSSCLWQPESERVSQ